MPVIREWRCGDCGTNGETMGPLDEVVCPTCNAQEAERVFLTPPAIRHDGTRVADRELRNLAQDYGLSNISNKDGGPVRKAPEGPQAPTFSEANPQTMAVLQRLGSQGNADGFSGVLPSLQRSGRPHQWRKTQERR